MREVFLASVMSITNLLLLVGFSVCVEFGVYSTRVTVVREERKREIHAHINPIGRDKFHPSWQ